MEHKLKCAPEFFEDIFKRQKNFEIRVNDRDFKVGDSLFLMEWSIEEGYTNAWCLRTITYITDFPAGLRDGYVCMGLK